MSIPNILSEFFKNAANNKVDKGLPPVKYLNFLICCHTATNLLKSPVYGQKVVAARWQQVAAKLHF
jgi:hypothetical protein